MKDKISRCKYVWILSTLLASTVYGAGVDPSLTTPDEQSKQRQLDAQEQQRKQEILKLLREQNEVKPDVRNEVEALKQTPIKASIEIPDNETPCFNINKIELFGEDALKFQFALDEVLKQGKQSGAAAITPILGSCLGVLGINAVMNRVQNVIFAKGYITTRILTAPQDLKAGTLQLTVIPGRINVIRLTPESSRYISPWLGCCW